MSKSTSISLTIVRELERVYGDGCPEGEQLGFARNERLGHRPPDHRGHAPVLDVYVDLHGDSPGHCGLGERGLDEPATDATLLPRVGHHRAEFDRIVDERPHDVPHRRLVGHREPRTVGVVAAEHPGEQLRRGSAQPAKEAEVLARRRQAVDQLRQAGGIALESGAQAHLGRIHRLSLLEDAESVNKI
jgi:hypothetical protein